MQIKDGRYYNLLVALNGTTATIVVNNKLTLSYGFDPRVDIYGIVHNFNDGMIGLGADNASATIDNVNLQVVPPAITFTMSDAFSTQPTLVSGETGSWTLSNGYYIGTPANGQSMALAGGDLTVGTAYLLQLEAIISTREIGGITFDQYDTDDFKWAAYSAATSEIMIGHYTARDGWVVDRSITMELEGDVTLAVTLKGSTVSVLVNDAAALSHVYNSVVTDGGFGLLAKDGEASFDLFTVRTDDPAFETEADAVQTLMAASAPDRVDNSDPLTYDALAPIVDEAITRWEDELAGDDEALALLGDLNFVITDFGDLTLGQTAGTTVFMDDDAAGYGWFVDSTPGDDTEFREKSSDGELLATPASEAYGDMDLLTAVMHEMGHVLGYGDVADDAAEVMSATLDPGERYESGDGAGLVVMDTTDMMEETEEPDPVSDEEVENSWLLGFLVKKARVDYNPFEPRDSIHIVLMDDEEEND